MILSRSREDGENERVRKVFDSVVKSLEGYEYITSNIESINDHKGELEITLKVNCFHSLIYNIFMVFWEIECEYNVSLYFNNKCVYGNSL